MVDYLSSFSKRIAHQAIELTFPLTDGIALVAAGAGWYAHRHGMTYSQQKMADATSDLSVYWLAGIIGEEYASKIGYVAAPIYVPSVAPEVSHYMGLGVYLATCFTLNLVARVFFGIKAKKDQENLLPSALQKMGLNITPQTSLSLSMEEEREILEPKMGVIEKPPHEAVKLPEIQFKVKAGLFKGEESITESDIFGDDDPLHKGCCSWKMCFSVGAG